MALSEEQMLLLEQITYFGQSNCFDKMGIEHGPDKTELLSWILHPWDSNGESIAPDDFMELLDKIPNDPTDMEIDGSEWKSIISAIRSDSAFESLTCVGYSEDAKAFCFENGDDNTATFVFQGTDGRWRDNFDGLYSASTEDQINAREFVETNGAGYDSVDLVGHSKGGNLAQYATITADYSKVNINRCISMDGQGFSKEFLVTYADQIMEHGGSIKNYCYKNDFVNILLNEVPGAEQIYCEGNDVGKDNHFSNSMFELVNTGTEDAPCWNLIWREAERNPAMEYLHDFTCYMANNMPLEQREKLGEYLGNLVQECMDSVDSNRNLTDDEIMKIVFQKAITNIESDPQHAAVILAYFIKYSKEKNFTDEQVYMLLKSFGLEDKDACKYHIITRLIKDFIVDHPTGSVSVAVILHALLKGIGVDELKGVDIDELAKYINLIYGLYATIKDDEFIEGDYVPAKIVQENASSAWSTSHGGLLSSLFGVSGKTIKVDTELLRTQSDELLLLHEQFQDLTSEMKRCIEESDRASSENLSRQMWGKVHLMLAELGTMKDLLNSGARAAHTAATTYESIDQALAKQISDL